MYLTLRQLYVWVRTTPNGCLFVNGGVMTHKALLRMRSQRRVPVRGTAPSLVIFSPSKLSSARFMSVRCGMPVRPPLMAHAGMRAGPPAR
jgi:hypothetical protein